MAGATRDIPKVTENKLLSPEVNKKPSIWLVYWILENAHSKPGNTASSHLAIFEWGPDREQAMSELQKAVALLTPLGPYDAHFPGTHADWSL